MTSRGKIKGYIMDKVILVEYWENGKHFYKAIPRAPKQEVEKKGASDDQ